MSAQTKTIPQLVEEYVLSTDYYLPLAAVPNAQRWRYVAAVSDLLRDRGDDTKIVERAALLLGHVGGDRAEDLLMEMLRRAEPTVRGAVLTALREIGSSARADVVIQCLGDPVPAVRKEALKTLAAIGDETCLPPVADYAERETEGYLCDLAQQTSDNIVERTRGHPPEEEG